MTTLLIIAGVIAAIYSYSAFAFHHNFKHFPM